jgi:putative tryptophan/tyrosine transport system substrate-binding protein
MITRRNLLIGLGAASLGAPLISLAQQQSKAFRIGFLGPVSASSYANRVAAFRQGLRELGYVEGKNITIEERWADGKYERLPRLAEELVKLKVDLIVATATPPARAAQQSTRTIPIVMVSVSDPVGSGLVASLARPGGNITGVANLVGDTTEKQFDLLVATAPKLSRIAVLSNPDNQAMQGLIKKVQASAYKIGARVFLVQARTPEEIDQAFSVMTQQGAKALIVLAEPLFFQQRAQLVNLAGKARLPAIYNARQYVEAGGLMSYGSDNEKVYRYAARYVDRILKGAKPSEMPVEQLSAMELTINKKTAKTLGITFPREVLVLADKVIE